MTLVRKVNLSIILCVIAAGVFICVIHWVNERRSALRTLEDEGRHLVRIMDSQLAALQGEPDAQGIQTLLNFACQWRPEIIEFTYYAVVSGGPAVGSLEPLASLPPNRIAVAPPLAYTVLSSRKEMLKRHYHDERPHVVICAPITIGGRTSGVIYLALSPDAFLERAKNDQQQLVNVWFLVGILTIVVIIIVVRFVIIGRVESLTQATQSGAREELELLGGSQPRDENGPLAQNINQMLRSIVSRNVVWERLYRASVQEEPAFAVDPQVETEDEMALATRDRIERELEIANRIQRSLLPEKFPEKHGLAFAVRYAPAGKVGGDLYDFVQVDADRLGIMIADVAGHGIPAAFVAGMTKIAFTQFSVHNPSPSAVVTAINDYLHSHLRTGHYVTIFYGMFNRLTKTFRFVRAGHQTPFVIRRDSNALEMLETGGPLVGAATKMKFEESEIALRPGDKIVMVTDGLSECKNGEGKRLGQEGLREILRGLGDKSAEAVAAEIFRKAAEFRGEVVPGDDITILVAEVRAEPPKA